MLRQICFVTLLLFVQHCKAQIPCSTLNATEVCAAPLYKPDECRADKCVCAEGFTPNTARDTCELIPPTMKWDNTAGKKYYTNVDYTLECSTAAKAVEFKWYKDADVLTDATLNTYTIKETKETAAIKYKCEITIGGPPASSAEVTVAVLAPGKVCTADVDCTDSEFSGKCDLTDPRRCVCAANYVVKEDTCSKNGAAVVSTSLLVLVVAIFSQLMNLS